MPFIQKEGTKGTLEGLSLATPSSRKPFLFHSASTVGAPDLCSYKTPHACSVTTRLCYTVVFCLHTDFA